MEETNTTKDTASLLLEKQYHIPFELFREAFIAFQRRFVYPRNYAVMAVFLIVAGVYGWLTATAPEGANRQLYCIIILFCLVMAVFQWWNPRKIRRNLMEGIRQIEDDRYCLRLYPEYLEIGTILPPEEDISGTRIYYNKGLHVAEYGHFFMVYQTRAMFYVIPKDAFSAEELEIVRVHFEKKLGKQFTVRR